VGLELSYVAAGFAAIWLAPNRRLRRFVLPTDLSSPQANYGPE
jgi:hypothetical protein